MVTGLRQTDVSITAARLALKDGRCSYRRCRRRTKPPARKREAIMASIAVTEQESGSDQRELSLVLRTIGKFSVTVLG
jgi:hypothetical protein